MYSPAVDRAWGDEHVFLLISSFRDVTVADEDAKVLGSQDRNSILSVVRSIVGPSAMGSGMNSGACDTAHMLVPEPLAAAMRINQRGYAIFGDIRTAFASMHKRIALMRDTDG